MEIEILYIDGCPHVQVTLNRVHRAMATSGIMCPIIETKVDNFETAQSQRFLGSPSVRVNGIDIEPAARVKTDFGIMCRRYDGSGVPPESLIQSAIVNAQWLA
jgi:hypothetical protein